MKRVLETSGADSTPYHSSSIFLILLLIIGFSLRLLFAWIRYDFHFTDEYTEVIRPAFQWLLRPDWKWETTMRSHLLPRLFFSALFLFKSLGIEDPITLVRATYSLFGLYSLLVIYILFLYSKGLEKEGVIFITLSVTLHYIFLDLSTKPNLDALGQPLLISGIYLVSKGVSSRRGWNLLSGSSMISLAVLVRYQLLFIFMLIFVFLILRNIYELWRRGREGLWLFSIPLFLIGGVVMVIGQFSIDILSGLKPFSMFAGFIEFQYRKAVNFGPPEQGWDYFWFFLVSKVFFPWTFFLILFVLPGIKRFPLEGILFFSLILIYHLSPWKEFRFIYPVLPLGFLLAGAGIDWLKGKIDSGSGFFRGAFRVGFYLTLIAYLVANSFSGLEEIMKRPYRDMIQALRNTNGEIPIQTVLYEGMVVPDIYIGGNIRMVLFAGGNNDPFGPLEDGTIPDTIILRRRYEGPVPSGCYEARVLEGTVHGEFWHIYRCVGNR